MAILVQSNKKPNLTFPSLTGSIVTFNSQYAGLPLKSHKIALTATQSGSGTPSPDNIRSINGVSSFGVSATGLNLWGGNALLQSFINANIGGFVYDTNAKTLTFGAPNVSNKTISNFKFKENTQYTFIFSGSNNQSNVNTNLAFRYTDGTNSAIQWTTGSSSKQVGIVVSRANKTIDYICGANYSGITTLYYDECCLLEGVHTIDDFEPFGTYTTINLGSTVYGGEYDARTGLFTVTQVKEILRGSYFEAYSASIQSARGGKPVGWLPWLTQTGGSCEMLSHGLPTTRSNIGNVSNGCFIGDAIGGNQGSMFIKFAGYSSLEDVQAFIEAQYNSNTPVEVVYELATPTTIQLPPCPIDTLEGVNNIFADTGDTTLQYIKLG